MAGTIVLHHYDDLSLLSTSSINQGQQSAEVEENPQFGVELQKCRRHNIRQLVK